MMAVSGCTGPAGGDGARGERGPAGEPGDKGDKGDDAVTPPSVSAVIPSHAFLGRTVDLNIAGFATNWTSSATVAFSSQDITVNSVLAASATGLVVNVTISPDAAVGPLDVTVDSDGVKQTFAAGFELLSPLDVTIEPPAGVPQGGYAWVHARMLDPTTPFEAKGLQIATKSPDVQPIGLPIVTDFGVEVMVQADVLAQAADVDLTITSGPAAKAVTSPLGKAFKVTTRAPKALMAGTVDTGTIAATADSVLYQYTPAGAGTRFLQLGAASLAGGGVNGVVIPKSGKHADALGAFGVRFGLGVTTADPLYVVARDTGFGAAPPYDFALALFDTPCTAVTESNDNITSLTADALATLPALVSGDLIDAGALTDDWYKVSITGASVQNPKTIHLATGGDAFADVMVEVLDTDGLTSLGNSAPDDVHKDLQVSVVADGTYYVRVFTGFGFDATHSAYELFVELP